MPSDLCKSSFKQIIFTGDVIIHSHIQGTGIRRDVLNWLKLMLAVLNQLKLVSAVNMLKDVTIMQNYEVKLGIYKSKV
jgi:hypothetical protein